MPVTPEAMTQALSAIHDVAQSALADDVPASTKENLELIMSIARYGTDVRADSEKSQARAKE